MLIITFACFEASYLVRFIFDGIILPKEIDSYFTRLMLWELVTILDGASFFALLYFHYRNFRGEPSQTAEAKEEDSFTVKDDMS